MQFESYTAIWFFWIIPLLLVLFLIFEKKRKGVLHRFYPANLLRTRLPQYSWVSYVVRFICLAVAILFLGIALLKPYSDYEIREVKRKGVDLYFLVDVSRSMLAQDVKPSRMDRAKREIVDFVKQLRGDRVGLIGFAGESFVFVPLTADYKAFDLFINELNPELFPVQGTDIKGAIEKSVKSFKSNNASRAIILITDGEDTVGLDNKIIADIKKLNIKVYVIGIGSSDGAPIPLPEAGYVKDEDGKVVLSRLNEAAMKELAITSGGGYVRSVSGDLDLEQIYYQGIKKSFEDVELASTQKKLPVYEFQLPILLAILLLFLEILITNKKRFWRGLFIQKSNTKSTVIVFFLLVNFSLLLLSPQVSAMNPFSFESANKDFDAAEFDKSLTKYLDLLENNPEDPELNYNLGANYYRLEKYSEAEESYKKALNVKDPELRQKVLYNLGNTKFKQGDLEGAVEYYEKALKTKEDYAEAKLNYEFVKKQLEEQEKQDQQDQSDQSDQSDQEREFDKNPQKWLNSVSDEPGDALRYMINKKSDQDKDIEKPW